MDPSLDRVELFLNPLRDLMPFFCDEHDEAMSK